MDDRFEIMKERNGISSDKYIFKTRLDTYKKEIIEEMSENKKAGVFKLPVSNPVLKKPLKMRFKERIRMFFEKLKQTIA